MRTPRHSLSPALVEAIDALRGLCLDPPPRRRRAGRPDRLPLTTRARPADPPADSAAALAGALSTGRLAPRAVVEEHLERADAWRDLNAFITVTADAARDFARSTVPELLKSRPLAGVPIAHKDIFYTRGVPTTGGSCAWADVVPTRSASAVRALHAGGLPMLGKTNTHELATGITGEVSAAGRTANPWAVNHVAGGSSSGSAAAVAAGITPLATASDTGGSARIPAACCGVVGFKPTYGRVPTAGVIPFSWTLDHVGLMARHSRDIALLAAAVTGSQPRALATPVTAPLGGLRYALPPASLAAATEPVADALRGVAAALESLGAQPVNPQWPAIFEHANGIAAAIFLREGAAVHARTLRERPDALQPPTRDLLMSASAISDDIYALALAARRAAIGAADQYFAEVDLLLAPTLPVPAPHRSESSVRIGDAAVDVRAALTRFTRLWNVTGNPAISVPCGFAPRGPNACGDAVTTHPLQLPIGAQFVAARGQDDLLLAVAATYEACRGPFPAPALSIAS
jgi:aspartyl-tRNA(Asn)/glutamyl-tRNA(Gln) amidotransferase subunit A